MNARNHGGPSTDCSCAKVIIVISGHMTSDQSDCSKSVQKNHLLHTFECVTQPRVSLHHPSAPH